MSDPPAALQVTGLTRRRGDVTVLRDVSFTIAPGQVHAVVGASGGGKTTLLRCLVGLDPFEAGQVETGPLRLGPAVDERRDAALLRSLRQRLGLVFQQYHLFPHLTVLDNLTLASRLTSDEPPDALAARARALLARLGLDDRTSASPSQLSGGQQQRVAIARALMVRPAALLLDEPTSALDARRAASVQQLLASLARDGLSLLIVTHSLDLARRLADQLHVLDEGQLVESGPPAHLLASPTHPATRALVQA